MAESSTAKQSDRIQVYARVRPVLPRERGEGSAVEASGNSVLVTTFASALPQRFNFDAVLPSSSVQEDAFKLVQPLLDSALQGYNVTVFAYVPDSSYRCESLQLPRPRHADCRIDCMVVPSSAQLRTNLYRKDAYYDGRGCLAAGGE